MRPAGLDPLMNCGVSAKKNIVDHIKEQSAVQVGPVGKVPLPTGPTS